LDNTHTLILSRADGTTYTHTADVVISANGPLSTPLLPKIPGIDSFQGISFHNLHWRNDVDFTNKKVAVIGSGSSGIQLVPGVAEIAGVQLVHYVRSGGYFFPKGE
jgi:cation diffusion facilitator CzcD-associated flavoprotein CzcO